MTELQRAIKYIESLIKRRTNEFSNDDATALTLIEAEYVLGLLKTHDAKESTLQFDMEQPDIDCFGF